MTQVPIGLFLRKSGAILPATDIQQLTNTSLNKHILITGGVTRGSMHEIIIKSHPGIIGRDGARCGGSLMVLLCLACRASTHMLTIMLLAERHMQYILNRWNRLLHLATMGIMLMVNMHGPVPGSIIDRLQRVLMYFLYQLSLRKHWHLMVGGLFFNRVGLSP
jgi:hypothetical protein